MPLDILLPYWGDPGWMREAVRSVLAQRNGDWLLTVLDDANPDPWAGPWLESLGDPRITYVRKPVNEGITAAFRSCVELATQERLVVLGSDDVLLPDYVDVVLGAHAAYPTVAMIQPGVEVIDEQGRTVRPLVDRVKQGLLRPGGGRRQVVGGEPLATSLMHGDWLYWPSLAFRREPLLRTPFREGLAVIQDLALVMDLVLAGESLLVEPAVCFRYRRHGGSASVAALLDGVRFAGEREYFSAASDELAARGWPRAARAARLHATSRLHALTLLPAAVRRGGRVAPLLAHATGLSRR